MAKKARPSHSSQGSNYISSPGDGSSPFDGSCCSSSPEPNRSIMSLIYDKLASVRFNLFSSSKRHRVSPQMLALEELEFRRAFLVLSYMGGRKLEEKVSVHEIRSFVAESKNLEMGSFESLVWQRYGNKHCSKEGRMKYRSWDLAGQYYFYHCHVHLDGSYDFKGPFLSVRTTLLQKTLKDENVLIVKFTDDEKRRSSVNVSSSASFAALENLARDGIYFGKRCYRFFAFKNSGKREKDPIYSSVKCYFVNIEEFAQCYGFDNHPREARSAFLHLESLPNLSKYSARLELVLSKTVTLPVDLEGEDVSIQVIDDIPCQYADGSAVIGQDGTPLIHTDGTGFISEDLALKCSLNGFKRNLLNSCSFKGFVGSSDFQLSPQFSEPPLLLQIRLFNVGYAVKGTLLRNRKLGDRTIQLRPSMIKACGNLEGPSSRTVKSLEVVTVSDQPKKAYLSKNLIALLNYGGVPGKFFIDLLQNALADTVNSLTNVRAALQVAFSNGNIDDDYLVAKMISCGIPLDEPYIQIRVAFLANQQGKKLKEGKLPIEESFYVIGTADPTGSLDRGEVCIIHENGQISGKVLVYRNPGIHFGDVHVLDARHIEGLEEIVGNAKYGIFFPTKGPRSLADMMARGDFDGDKYWVSRHPELLKYFNQSEAWTCMNQYSSNSDQKRPTEYSDEELEHELFSRFLKARFQPSKTMGVAFNSWLAYMDQLLTVGGSHTKERTDLKAKMLKLVDIYYEALDAPKKGGEVTVPRELIPTMYPHYMEVTNSLKTSYMSTSVLGEIYDQACEWELKTSPVSVWKLLPLDVEVPHRNMKIWQRHYNNYRAEMGAALTTDNQEERRVGAAKVMQKYKQILYEAPEFEESPRPWEEISIDALAIYHITYNYAMKIKDAGRCGFAWRVAGAPLIKIFIENRNDKSLTCSVSVLQEIISRK